MCNLLNLIEFIFVCIVYLTFTLQNCLELDNFSQTVVFLFLSFMNLEDWTPNIEIIISKPIRI